MPATDPTLTPTRLVVRVLQDLIANGLDHDKESLKCRCAQLRIPYDSMIINDALDRVEGQARRQLPPRRVLVEREPEGPILSKAEAAAILARLGVGV